MTTKISRAGGARPVTEANGGERDVTAMAASEAAPPVGPGCVTLGPTGSVTTPTPQGDREALLLTCPWGCAVESLRAPREYEWTHPRAPAKWWCGCSACGFYKEGMTAAEALAAWNTRATPTALTSARLEARAEALEGGAREPRNDLEINVGDHWRPAKLYGSPDRFGLFSAEDTEEWDKWTIHLAWEGVAWRNRAHLAGKCWCDETHVPAAHPPGASPDAGEVGR